MGDVDTPMSAGLPPRPERIAFLGDYLPRLCGLATFTHDLCESVASACPSSECYVVAVNDRAEGYGYTSRVRFEIDEQDRDSYGRGGDFLNVQDADLLCIQHEFGIYGGPAGSHLLKLLRQSRIPVVTTLHTILTEPDDDQRKVMEEIISRSSRLVVMARKGVEILQETYGVSLEKIDLIPHGIPDLEFTDPEPFKEKLGLGGHPVLLTFGLIGPGKGIEHVIEALPGIVARHPDVLYVILGATHPHLVEREGERYRSGLESLARERGVENHVRFENRFVSQEDLKDFIEATDIYITPYLNEAQITSGTLSYVFGSGKAVVSTPYWHARELLEGGNGSLVPFRDPAAISEEVGRLLDDPLRMKRIRGNAYRAGREMIWPAVAERYMESFRRARSERRIRPRGPQIEERRSAPESVPGGWVSEAPSYPIPQPRYDHLVRMSDGTGIFQHAIYTVPNFHEGYCVDDNSRAYILCNLLAESGEEPPHPDLHRLATGYLAFLNAAFNPLKGRFRNFMNHSRQWLEEEGSEDSHGRSLWGAGTGASRSRDAAHSRLSAEIFRKGLGAVERFTSPRAWSLTLLGIHEYMRRFPEDEASRRMRETLTGRLLDLWASASSHEWPWPEEILAYDNARLCQALILSGRNMPHSGALEIGLHSLRWLASIQKSNGGHFRPVGSNGFYRRDSARADFDQQPLEAQAMVSASLEAFRATADPDWLEEARRAFEWFLGRNDLSLPLYDVMTGGCSDGLHADRVSENQGAESTLAFHIALAEMRGATHPLTGATLFAP